MAEEVKEEPSTWAVFAVGVLLIAVASITAVKCTNKPKADLKRNGLKERALVAK